MDLTLLSKIPQNFSHANRAGSIPTCTCCSGMDVPAALFFLCVPWGWALCTVLHNMSELLKAETTLLLLNPYSPRVMGS